MFFQNFLVIAIIFILNKTLNPFLDGSSFD